MTIPLGGEDRTLLFGAMGYFLYLQKASGMDAYQYLNRVDERRKEDAPAQERLKLLTEDGPMFVYAGLNCQRDFDGKPEVDFETVKKMCNALTPSLIGEVMNTSFIAMASDTIDEPQGEPKTQAEAATA